MADVTNYIDRLVAELCPDGVEYRPLGDAVEYARKREKDGVGVHLYVGVENLKSDFLGCSPVSGSKGGIIFQKDDILLGNIRPYLKKMWLSNTEGVSSPDVLVLRIQENEEGNILAKYLYYILSLSKFVTYNISHSRGGKMPRGNKVKILEFEVPVPPMEIQEAVVEILNKFTNLETELEAELEARILQYEYYRDSLFETLDCPRNPLGSFAQYSKDRKKDDSTVSVYVGVENLKSDFQGCIPTESTNPGVIFRKDDILLGNIRPYLKKMWRADSDGVASPDVLVVRIRDEFSENISSRYLYHLLASNEFVGYNVAHSRGGKMPRGNKAKILEFEAPIPPLEEQQRIVDILDRFDALTTSLSEGLPAELAARRSQYEYYRDQLLSFPRKGENQ